MPTRWATTGVDYNDFMDGIRNAVKVVTANNTTAAVGNGWKMATYGNWTYGTTAGTWAVNPYIWKDVSYTPYVLKNEKPKEEPLPDFDGEALDELAMTVPGESA